MSEFIDAITSEVPDRCRKCPVLLAYLALANDYERQASNITESLMDFTDTNPDLYTDTTAMHTLMSDLLDATTASELRTNRTVELLVMSTAICAGVKRGLPQEYRLVDRMQAYLMHEQTCQNPELESIIER